MINHSELSVVFATANHIQQLLDSSAACPGMKMVVSIDPLDAEAKRKYVDLGKEKGIDVKELKECMDPGLYFSLSSS